MPLTRTGVPATTASRPTSPKPFARDGMSTSGPRQTLVQSFGLGAEGPDGDTERGIGRPADDGLAQRVAARGRGTAHKQFDFGLGVPPKTQRVCQSPRAEVDALDLPVLHPAHEQHLKRTARGGAPRRTSRTVEPGIETQWFGAAGKHRQVPLEPLVQPGPNCGGPGGTPRQVEFQPCARVGTEPGVVVPAGTPVLRTRPRAAIRR